MLELKQATIGYRNQPVLSDVTLSFLPGQIYTILGKNGCGKSTLLKTCAGLLPPSSGSVLLDGTALGEYAPNQRAQRISYLSQSRSVPNITVERLLTHSRHPYLSYPRKLNPEDRDIIRHALDRMEATAFAHRSLTELSGGERQRVYLAMQLAQDAPTLLLDEPTTYLDIQYQLELMELLTSLRQEGKTILMVLHDLDQALRYSDKILAIDDSKRIHQGTPYELLANHTLDHVFHVRIQRNLFAIEKSLTSR